MRKRRVMRRCSSYLRNSQAMIAEEICGLPQRTWRMVWTENVSYAAACDAAAGTIWLNWDWFKTHPDDYGCIAHEYTHLVQNIPGGTCPSEVVEGFADAVRYMLGLYDPSWWSPSPMAEKIAKLDKADRLALSGAMSMGAYSAYKWPDQW